MSLYDKIFPPKEYTLANGKTVSKPASRMPLVCLIVVLMCAVSVRVTGFDLSVLIKRGEQFFVILEEMFTPPNWSYHRQVWAPLFDTIKMSLLGSVIGTAAAVPFAVLASTNIIKSRIVVSATRLMFSLVRTVPTLNISRVAETTILMFSLVRTVPTLVCALVATYVFGLGTLAGTTAIAIFTFAYMGKILYEEIETVDMGAYEAAEALGASKPRAFACAIIPQVLPSYISNTLFCFEGNVRYASILGYVGAGGLGLVLNERLGWRDYASAGTILIMLFVTVFIIETISRYCRKKLV